MQRLSKSQETARAVLLDDLRNAAEQVKDAVAAVNRSIDMRINTAVANYNEALAAVQDIKDEVLKAQEEYFCSQSVEWQEGVFGAGYDSWRSDWELLDLDPLLTCLEVDVPDMSHADDLEKLASEPEEE
jgi:hypothetical protein